MKLNLRPVDWVALGFAAAAVLLFALAMGPLDGAWVDEWMPNLSVEALSIAATILIVDRIVRHQEERRMRPRLDAAYNGINREFGWFLVDVERDYAETHTTPQRRVRHPSGAVLERWLAGVLTNDAEQRRQGDGLPSLLHSARRLVDKLEPIVDRDREVLPPTLVAAIDHLETDVHDAFLRFESSRSHPEAGRPGLTGPLETVIWGARVVEQALQDHGIISRSLLPELERLAQAQHDHYVARELARGETAVGNPTLVSWHLLPESLKESNRALAASLGQILIDSGFAFVPAPLVDAERESLKPPDVLIEQLARHEHSRWREDLLRDGWRSGSADDPQRKINPKLVAWEELDEHDREIDRDWIEDWMRELPRMLSAVGLAMTRRDSVR